MFVSKINLLEALRAWGDSMVAISLAYEQNGFEDAQKLASEMLDCLYGYSMGSVLFKPTLSGGAQTFRTTKDGALSYFIGSNPDYPFDSGFAIKCWQEVNSETKAMFLDENFALWMGWVTLVNTDGRATKVDKSFGYKLCKKGRLRIILHHSSLPYQPQN